MSGTLVSAGLALLHRGSTSGFTFFITFLELAFETYVCLGLLLPIRSGASVSERVPHKPK